MCFEEIKSCRVCGSTDIFPFIELDKFPLIGLPLDDDKKRLLEGKGIPKWITLRYGMCKHCTHIFQLLSPKRELLHTIYESCYTNYVPKLRQGIGTTFEEKFMSVFLGALNRDIESGVLSSTLEIGCNDGYILSRLKDEGLKVYGCDPSEGAVVGQQYGLEIIRDYFSPGLFDSRKFDAVINRNLLEHMEKPVSFLSAIREVVEDEGRIIIETPNASYFMEKGLIDPFTPLHISVFTPKSISTCLLKVGLGIEHEVLDENIIVFAHSNSSSDSIREREGDRIGSEDDTQTASRFQRLLHGNIDKLDEMAGNLMKKGRRLALWGAGSSGNTILSLSKVLRESDAIIVDRDTNKHGLTHYNFDRRIYSPWVLKEKPVDYIIIASQYGEEIVRDIRELYGFKSHCVLLSPQVRIV